MWASMSLLKLNGNVLAVQVNTNKTFLDVSEFALILSKGYLDLYNFLKGNHTYIVQYTAFMLERFRHEFDVIPLW
jgi:hypothetical protein